MGMEMGNVVCVCAAVYAKTEDRRQKMVEGNRDGLRALSCE
jgi:hypothetical protein